MRKTRKDTHVPHSASKQRRTGVGLWLSLSAFSLLAGCAEKKPPPPKPPAPPPPPIVGKPTIGHVSVHEISFTPSNTYAGGIRLGFTLLQADGYPVHRGTLKLGGHFDSTGPVTGGTKIVRHLQRAKGIRVTNKDEREALDLQFRDVVTAELKDLASCKHDSYIWRMGLPVPPHLRQHELPKPGDRLARTVCTPVNDTAAKTSFAYRRYPDPNYARVRFAVEFNRDYPRGVSFDLVVPAPKGARASQCTAAIKQPAVWDRDIKTYDLLLSQALPITAFENAGRITARNIKTPRAAITGHSEIVLTCR